MTEHLSDELLSGAIDGHVPSGQMAHLTACSLCADRMARLGQAAAMFGEAVAVPPLVLEQTVAAALAATHDTARIRRHRPRLRRSSMSFVAAAAVMLVAVVAVSSLRGADVTDNAVGTDTGTAMLESASGDAAKGDRTTGLAADGQASAPGGASAVEGFSGNTMTENLPIPEAGDFRGDLGSYDDIVVLTDKIRADLNVSEPSPSTAGTTAPERVRACSLRIADEHREAGEQIYTGAVMWRGTDAVVLVRRLTDPTHGSYRLWVTSARNCVTLIDDTF